MAGNAERTSCRTRAGIRSVRKPSWLLCVNDVMSYTVAVGSRSQLNRSVQNRSVQYRTQQGLASLRFLTNPLGRGCGGPPGPCGPSDTPCWHGASSWRHSYTSAKYAAATGHRCSWLHYFSRCKPLLHTWLPIALRCNQL